MRKLIIIPLLFFCSIQLYSQKKIPISYHKNVNLIFSGSIVKDDYSSDAILLSHDANILKIGAAEPFTHEKSISVLTEDNIFFTFIIYYDENLDTLTYIIPDSLGIEIPYSQKSSHSVIATNTGEEIYAKKLERLTNLVYQKPSLYSEVGESYKQITVELAGIWVSDNLLFFKLLMGNDSNIPYEISSINLYVKDKQKVKKASTQPLMKEPILIDNDSNTIPAKSSYNNHILVFESFTISHDKKLMLEVVEKNGGRNITFEIIKDLIIKATVLN